MINTITKKILKEARESSRFFAPDEIFTKAEVLECAKKIVHESIGAEGLKLIDGLDKVKRV